MGESEAALHHRLILLQQRCNTSHFDNKHAGDVWWHQPLFDQPKAMCFSQSQEITNLHNGDMQMQYVDHYNSVTYHAARMQFHD
jgi:hypothetical protein